MIKILISLLLFSAISFAQDITTITESRRGLLSNNVKAIYIDKDNTKWFATDKGISILRDNGKWSSVKVINGLPSEVVTDITGYAGEADSSFIEVATEAGIVKLYVDNDLVTVLPAISKGNSELVSDTVTCLSVNGKSNVHWFGTHLGVSTLASTEWHLFTDIDYLSSNNVTDIISSTNDWTYIATSDGGVSRLKQDVDGISRASEITTDWSGIASDSVYTIFIDHLGQRWYGTTQGLSMHFGNRTKRNWTNYSTDDGLVNNAVTAIAEDISSTMWFGTLGGVSTYDGSTWENFTTANGLLSNTVSALAVDNNGDIWIATDNGVAHLIKERKYIVKKVEASLVIDGKLDEAEWQNALLTEPFVKQKDGTSVSVKTQGKLLWDDQYLYIGIIAYDQDVWGKLTNRDSHLWEEEPVEVFCDPDNDKKNYFEIEINSRGTELDILMDKSYLDGGTADFSWDIAGFKSAVSIAGTLNNPADTDTAWYCEMAIPFTALDSRIMSSMSNPPVAGDIWRLNLARYNRKRDNEGNELSSETSCWSKTGTSLFHVPEKFGHIVFSDEVITSVRNINSKSLTANHFELIGNYPNPFNPSTVIAFNIFSSAQTSLKIYNVLGQLVATLVNEELGTGSYEYKFEANNLSSGIFFVRLESNGYSETKKIMLLK